LPPFDLTVAPGERICILGENGAGKSSLLQVMAGLRRPDAGQVELNGQDLSVTNARRLRQAVSLVSCDLPLLRGSLRFNLRYGLPEASEEALAEVTERCGLTALVARQPQGLDTQLKEQQSRFSAGERLRIALARGLLPRPQVLLLDEMDAHLDAEGVRALERIIEAFEGPVVFITHRPERARLAHRVVMLRAGAPAAVMAAAELPAARLRALT
jgi:ABC-type bacteriocin/lantibiotic exporter with double-glycine peptidase domain